MAIMLDFNIDPEFSAEVITAILEGSWTDAGTIRPKIDGSSPMPTFSQRTCLLELISACSTIVQRICLGLLPIGTTRSAQFPITSCNVCLCRLVERSNSRGNLSGLTRFQTLRSYKMKTAAILRIGLLMNLLASSARSSIITTWKGFWIVWCRLAERWLVHHCAFARA